jgi:4-hydroxyphenylpyruvate dioxygenase
MNYLKETTKRGAKGVMDPVTISDEHGEVVISAIQTYGETIHKFIERKNQQRGISAGLCTKEP